MLMASSQYQGAPGSMLPQYAFANQAPYQTQSSEMQSLGVSTAMQTAIMDSHSLTDAQQSQMNPVFKVNLLMIKQFSTHLLPATCRNPQQDGHPNGYAVC